MLGAAIHAMITDKMNRARIFNAPALAVACLALSLSSCATAPERRMVPSSTGLSGGTSTEINQALVTLAAQTSASSTSYQIGPEDLLQITLFNIPESEGRVTPRLVSVRVNQNGSVMLPLLGEITVKGLTISALEQVLRERYDKFIHNPQIGILVTEFRQRVSVIGAVQRPGMVELTGPKTLIDVLALAGGLTEKASSQVQVYRNTTEGRQNYVIDLLFLSNSSRLTNAEQTELVSMPMQVGDIVNVPQAGTVFIDGAVKNPGSYSIPRRYSLTQALVLAGGVEYDLADYSGATIFRRRNQGEVQSIPANLNEIQAGNAPDPQIEPDDVIVVPVSPAKFFVKRFVGTIISGFSLSPFGH